MSRDDMECEISTCIGKRKATRQTEPKAQGNRLLKYKTMGSKWSHLC